MVKYLSLLLCLVAGHAAAAPKEPPSGSSQFSITPFELDQPSLPKVFKGNRCRTLTTKLATAGSPKGEFETSAKYESRIAVLQKMKLVGAVLVDSRVAFVDEISSDKVTFDADRGMLSIQYSSPSILNLTTPEIKTGFISDTLRIASKVYVGSNAYGKAANIKQTTSDSCAIGFQNALPSFTEDRIIQKELLIEEAKSAKGNMAVLYIGILAPPFSVEYQHYMKPTMDFPYEFISTGRMLLMTVEHVWVFNKKTGQIYEKL